MSLTRRVHRIEVADPVTSVRVRLGGEVLAETQRARRLTEAGLPPRWYIPAQDVRDELLEPCDRTTRCPWKGQAIYRSARVGDRFEEAVAWSYPDPRRGVAPIAGHWCFYQERVEVEVEGS